jgi:protein-tyrosine phosphatase
MIDIHSHVIWHMDDGARDMRESMNLIRSDVRQGADQIIATPHYYVEHPSDPDKIRRRAEILGRQTERESLPVRLYTGNEVLYFDKMTEHLDDGRILTLAGSRYTLIEFYTQDSYSRILRAVRSLRWAGYRPIIAHAERFPEIRRHGLADIREEGGYIQVSTQPLGVSGVSALVNPEALFVRKALKNREVEFLGTDMHRIDTRPPVLYGAIRWVRRHLEEGYAEAVLSGNAEKILADQEI